MSKQKKAWVVAVDMGYGHERAAYGLRHLAFGDIVVANNYPGIPPHDRSLWKKSRLVYETISRIQPTPIIGDILFEAIDRLQEIPQFYPRRDLSKPTFQVKEVYSLIEKGGLGKDLIETLRKKPLPFITTFFIPAFAAEVFDYPNEIYCVLCDADISRAWVAKDPKKSRIKYFAPNGRVVERLKLYGVKPENIFLTGFPLPKELIGGVSAKMVKANLAARLCNLDPKGIFLKKYHQTLRSHLGSLMCEVRRTHPLTLTFSVGGAGAQKKLGVEIIESLRVKIQRRKINVNLVAGVRREAARFYHDKIEEMGLKKELGKGLNIYFYSRRADYFKEFSTLLKTTDILWTKPSELSFYTGLGIPIIMAPFIGSQESFNRIWLKTVGGGVSQNDPQYTDEWLFDWLESGGLARMAWNGFIEAPTHGAFRIEEIITGVPVKLERLPLIV